MLDILTQTELFDHDLEEHDIYRELEQIRAAWSPEREREARGVTLNGVDEVLVEKHQYRARGLQ